jgi:hypothetical protein
LTYALETPVRGNSNNDVRQSFNAALTYEIPGGGSSRFVRALTHGWIFANRFTALSGYPLNVIQGMYSLPTGAAVGINPDLVQGIPIYLHNVPGVLGGWKLNQAAFSSVPVNPNGSPKVLGSLGRNAIHGPAFWVLNTAVQRNLLVGEHLRLIARAEAFNLLNHANAGSIRSNLSQPDFGQATATGVIGATSSVGFQGASVPLYASGAPRSLQLSLKLQF